MAEMKFLGFKEVLLDTFNGLSDAEKVGYVWFVKADSEAETKGDIYLGARHYGHFNPDAASEEEIEAINQVLSDAGIVDESGNTVDIKGMIDDLAEKVKENEVQAGEFVEVSGSTVSVVVSEDEGNLIKKGVDGGLFAALYYECLDDEDLEKTI